MTDELLAQRCWSIGDGKGATLASLC